MEHEGLRYLVVKVDNGVEEVINTLPNLYAANSYMEYRLLQHVQEHHPCLIYPCEIVAGDGYCLTYGNEMVSFVVRVKGE